MTNKGLIALLGRLALWLLIAVASLTHADAQQIAAIVNNQVISRYDLDRRIALFMATANLDEQPGMRERLEPDILRNLIMDRLKSEEVRRLNIVVSREDVDRALAQIATQLRVDVKDLPGYLAQRGAQMSALVEQVEGEIGWTKAVGRLAGSQMAITEQEIDDELARQQEQVGVPEYRVAEIFLPLESGSDPAQVEALAQRLIGELRSGANFPTLARTFSQGPAAESGGDLGWVRRGQLPPELDKYLEELDPGELIGPLRTPAGYHLLLMIRKEEGRSGGPGATLSVLQLFAPLPGQANGEQAAAASRTLEQLARQAQSCAELETLNGEQATPFASQTTPMNLRQLPAEVERIMAPLQVGQSTPPLRVNNGMLMMMVCSRSEGAASAEQREAAIRQLEQRKASDVARRVLRDLRRQAVVDVRL